MRSKIKNRGGRGRKPKRPREDEIIGEKDENQNAKKNRSEIFDEPNEQIKLFEERFKDALKTGIDLFHNRISLSAISFKERLAYYIILRKVMSSLEWKLKRLISNKQQIECLTRKAIESPKERKDMLTIMEKFVEYKLKSFPGKTKHFKAESIAKHYKCELKCYGVTQDILSTKIDDLIKTIEVTEGPLPKIEKSLKQNIKILNIKKNVCRLCGSKQNLIYSINQKKEDMYFKDVVEYFCRVKLEHNDNLPHLVCKGCKDYIENFSKYSEKILNFQNKLNLEAENFALPEEAIKMEVVDLDYEDTNLYNRDEVDLNNDSSQDCTEYSETEIEVGANYICNDKNHETTIDNSLQDEIPGMEPDIMIHNRSENNNNQRIEEQDTCDKEIEEIPHIQVHTSTLTVVPPSLSSSSNQKECKIILERLPIEYVPSDGEEKSQDELLDQNKKRKSGHSVQDLCRVLK